MRHCLGSLALLPALILCGCDASSSSSDAMWYAPTRTAASPALVDRDGSAWDVVDRVLLVSVDGFGAVYLGRPLSHGRYPTLKSLRDRGASTLNARTDCDVTMTLPDHTSMLTGRPIGPDPNLPLDAYHGWQIDSWDSPDDTLHNAGNPNLKYVSSVFDVAHDHGLKTCLYAGKSKFGLYSTSFDAAHGGIDHVGIDNGRNKIDHVFINDYDSEALVTQATADFDANLCEFVFFHIPETDLVGHNSGWGTPDWLAEVDLVDTWVRRLASHTIYAKGQSWGLIITADHGGNGNSHSDSEEPSDFTIPFFAVGPHFPPGSDLYELSANSRRDPGQGQLRYPEPWQPIRNGDAANVALGMLGLPAIPGSLMRGLVVPQ